MKPVLERFLKKINVSNNYYNKSPCWDWTASTNSWGYGHFGLNGKLVKSHRFSYELTNGKIPNGLQIDHLCRNRKCVNPSHLEAITQKENLMRGYGVCAINAKKTRCKRGHNFSGINKKGSRLCKICNNPRTRNITTTKYLETYSHDK